MIRHNQILKVYGTDYAGMTRRLLEAADLASLIPGPSTRIGIKPNLVSPTPASFGATTHPEVVAGIIAYLKDHGFCEILIAEGSWIGDRTEEAYEVCGYRALCEAYGVPFVDTQKDSGHPVDCGDLRIEVCDVTNHVDFWINVPVLKGHCQTKVTCALKNFKGLIPNAEKRRFHRLGLMKPIAALQKAIRQDFVVTDHICGDPSFEDGGSPLVTNCVMAARDPVLMDAYGAYLLGYGAEEVGYIPYAEELGIGSADLSGAEILALSDAETERGVLSDAGSEKEVLSDSGSQEAALSGADSEKAVFLPDTELPFRGQILDVSYAAEEADSCSTCYAALTGALARLKEEGLLEKLDTRIGIGQGMRGKSGTLGIGQCTADFCRSIPGCPPEEEEIYEGILAYMEERGLLP